MLSGSVPSGRIRLAPVFSHDFARNEVHDHEDPERQQYEIVEVAQDRYEFGNKVDWKKGVSDNDNGKRLGMPRYAGIAARRMERLQVALDGFAARTAALRCKNEQTASRFWPVPSSRIGFSCVAPWGRCCGILKCRARSDASIRIFWRRSLQTKPIVPRRLRPITPVAPPIRFAPRWRDAKATPLTERRLVHHPEEGISP